MTEQYDARLTQDTHDTTDQGARMRAFVGLGLALVGLMGGGILGNAVFFLFLEATYDSGAFSMVAQGLPSLAMGLAGVGLGWSASTSPDPVAAPAGRAGLVLGTLAALGAVAVMVAGQV
jgi:hypothetical protein